MASLGEQFGKPHDAGRVMPTSFPRDRISNQHLTNIKDSYNNHQSRVVPKDIGVFPTLLICIAILKKKKKNKIPR